ncbi:MAG TPA: SagB/ThcOx family dehydrogenase [Candidatus Dormibacteraeota bacterium]|jgi:SagB-type dehydrogenase family enzyme
MVRVGEVHVNRRYRVAQALDIRWSDGRLVLDNLYRRRSVSVEPELAPKVLSLLQRLSDWTGMRELEQALAGWDRPTAVRTFARLVASGCVVASDDLVEGIGGRLEPWHGWGREAMTFHFGTRDYLYVESSQDNLAEFVGPGARPPLHKTHGDAERVGLPAPRELSEASLGDALLQRRTVRAFRPEPVSLDQFAQLLWLTWGQTAWIESEHFGRLVKKTSPSGGARHPIEVYPVVLNVSGLEPGVYHYAPLSNELELLARGDQSARLAESLSPQGWLVSAGAVFVMTAVFARTMWKYGNARAYRAILLEAGHLGQTFHLVATALGLGPFTSIAFHDSRLESLLGVDGIDEAALYLAAAGVPDPTEPTLQTGLSDAT